MKIDMKEVRPRIQKTIGDETTAFLMGGLRYDIEASSVIASADYRRGRLRNDFLAYDLRLFRTANGRHFIVVDGYVEEVESGGWCFGRGVFAVDEAEARHWWGRLEWSDRKAFPLEEA